MRRKVILLYLGLGALGLAVFGGIIGGAVYYDITQRLYRPGPHEADTTLIVPRGQPTSAVITGLVDIGALAEKDKALMLRYIRYVEAVPKAGEFLIPAEASLVEVVELLESGDVVVRRFTIPEGLTHRQIDLLLQDVPGLTGEVTEWPEEGWLYPATYHFHLGDTRQAVIDRMNAKMIEVVDKIWEEHPRLDVLENKEALVTLASVVERETGVDEERSLVASVFHNRLNIKMALQSDPTIIYWESEKLGVIDHPLKRSQMRRQQPYNSYINRGLPPTAIANPGLDALLATLNPAETDNLFFVADGKGGHLFAKTYAHHRRNINIYRRYLRNQAKG
ncbi:MAG: endolytic transglycosylase MltG [Alphaproteobacteria bacterium]|nr:endolytic transglycosylase MltG [Alphaproteobacteria bacterium]